MNDDDDYEWLGPPVPEGDRTAARAMLANIAKGIFSADERAWLQDVAARVLAADDEPDPRRRGDRIAAAMGLEGRIDRHRELWTWLHALDGFEFLDGEPKRADRIRDLLRGARREGLIKESMDEADALKLIDRLLRKSPDF